MIDGGHASMGMRTRSLSPDCLMLFTVFSSIVPVVRASSPNGDEKTDKDWEEQYIKFAGGHPDDFTPTERLRRTLVSIWERENWEHDMVSMTAHAAFVCGGIMGMMARNEENKLTSIRQNSDVQFDHPFLAQRKMRDQQYMRNVKNGFKLGWRTSLFSLLLCSGSLSALSYRNYANPLDFAVVYGAIGAVWKWQKGPKGMLSAATVTGSFGLLVGCFLWSALKVSGVTVAEFRVRMGGAMTESHLKDSKKKVTLYQYEEPGFKILLDREMMMQQRMFDERRAQHESQLRAKQTELAQAVQQTK